MRERSRDAKISFTRPRNHQPQGANVWVVSVDGRMRGYVVELSRPRDGKRWQPWRQSEPRFSGNQMLLPRVPRKAFPTRQAAAEGLAYGFEDRWTHFGQLQQTPKSKNKASRGARSSRRARSLATA